MASKAHSEEFFGASRSYWWNTDFLELMTRRWGISKPQRVLDLGCGRGHWSFELARVLPGGSQILGVDPEQASIDHANREAQNLNSNTSLSFQIGQAEELEFEDESFDFVTCQTLLIHLASPKAALEEMFRVLRPGGLLVAIEPNNLANSIRLDNLDFSLEKRIDLLKFQARCERGKAKLSLGFNSFGDSVPGIFSELGLKEIQVFLSDKVNALYPPYPSQEQKTIIDEMKSGSRDESSFIWSKEETKKYFFSDGGSKEEFEACWSLAQSYKKVQRKSLESGNFQTGGATVTYLTSGRK